MENPTLTKNLECIERYNPKLKEDLLNMESLTSSFELVETKLNEPNLIYNGIPLHSPEGAEVEAKNIFNSNKNTPSSLHVIFGIGLGHLFKEFCEHSKGTVLVYEPNLEILRVTLELVDFSHELLQNNVIITSDLDTFKNFCLTRYSYNANASFIFLNSYRNIYEKELNEIVGQVEVITGICMSTYNTLKHSIALSSFTMVENISETLNETPLLEIKDSFRGKEKGPAALIVSAGPTLDANIETIKKNRDKVVIFCVGTALKALVKNGIYPDFLNVIEVNDCSGQIKDINLSNVNMILEPYTHKTFHQAKAKKKFLFPTNSSHANYSWSEITGVDISDYTAKGTVSYEAITSAKILGFTKIILVGQDLAYVNNQCYSKDSAYSELAYEVNSKTNQIEIKIKDKEKYVDSLIPKTIGINETQYRNFADYKIQNLNDTLYYVKGITGEMLPTQGGYATFIEHFREFASQNQDLDLINTSMIGAEIEGFKNIPLEKALSDVEPIREKADISSKAYPYNKERILKKLDDELTLLKNAFKDFEKAQEYIFKYEREFRRSKTTNEETGRYFKLLLSLYIKICEEYKSQSKLFYAISYAEDIDVEFALKETEVVDIPSILTVYELLKRYYNFAGQKLVGNIKLMEKQKEILIEGSNTESCKSVSNN